MPFTFQPVCYFQNAVCPLKWFTSLNVDDCTVKQLQLNQSSQSAYTAAAAVLMNVFMSVFFSSNILLSSTSLYLPASKWSSHHCLNKLNKAVKDHHHQQRRMPSSSPSSFNWIKCTHTHKHPNISRDWTPIYAGHRHRLASSISIIDSTITSTAFCLLKFEISRACLVRQPAQCLLPCRGPAGDNWAVRLPLPSPAPPSLELTYAVSLAPSLAHL